MRVAILHQDLEWPEQEFERQFQKRGVDVDLYDVRSVQTSQLQGYDVVLNRVYASVANRDFYSVLRAQSLVESLGQEGITCINSVVASRADYSKDYAAKVQGTNGLIVPRTHIISGDSLYDFVRDVGFPLIGKRNTGGRAVDLAKIDDLKSLERFIAQRTEYGGTHILQEFLPPVLAHDYRVTVVDGEIAFSYTRSLLSTEDGEKPWLASVSKGSNRVLCDSIPEEVAEVALEGTKAIQGFLNSLDITITERGPAIIENNLTPNYSTAPDEIEKSRKMIGEVTRRIVDEK